MDVNKIIEEIKGATVLEINELVKACEEEFGVSAAAPVAVAVAGGGEAAGGGDEKTDFTIELTEVGGEKVKIIKIVREITGLGLKEAKDMVDGAPSVVKEGVPKADAEAFAKQIEEAGGKAVLK